MLTTKRLIAAILLAVICFGGIQAKNLVDEVKAKIEQKMSLQSNN